MHLFGQRLSVCYYNFKEVQLYAAIKAHLDDYCDHSRLIVKYESALLKQLLIIRMIRHITILNASPQKLCIECL